MSNSSNKTPVRATKIPHSQVKIIKSVASATPQAKVAPTSAPAPASTHATNSAPAVKDAPQKVVAPHPVATTSKNTPAPKASAKPTTKIVKKAAAPKKKVAVKNTTHKTVKIVVPKKTTTTKQSASADSWDWSKSWEWGNYNFDFIPMEEHTKHYETAIETNKQLLKALEQSSQTAFKGYNDIMKISLSFATTSIDKILEMCSSFANSNDPAETLEKTLKSLHKELESIIAHQNKISDASIKSVQDVAKPISSHIDSSIKNALNNISKMY